MKMYHYFYYILENMKKLNLTSEQLNLLFFLRYYFETGQEVDLEVIAYNMNLDLMYVASLIEQLLEKDYIKLSRNGFIQYDTNCIYELEMQQQKQEQSQIINKFEVAFNRPITQKEVTKIAELINDYPHKLVEYALREALLYNAKNIAYVEKILINWKKSNFTVEDYEQQN